MFMMVLKSLITICAVAMYDVVLVNDEWSHSGMNSHIASNESQCEICLRNYVIVGYLMSKNVDTFMC